MKELHYIDIANLCQELSMLLHAGISVADGLALLADGEEDPNRKALFVQLSDLADSGVPLSEVLQETGVFPAYMVGLVSMGERSGRLEESLTALWHYYESRDRLDRQVRSALLHPSVMLMLMLVVIVVLLTRVLPVFEDVYASLGGQLTGMAAGLLTLGMGLNKAMPVLCALLAVICVFLAAFSVSGQFRKILLTLWRQHRGDRGISHRLNEAHFAQAMAMGLGSGLPLEESLSLTEVLLQDVAEARDRCGKCRELLESGESLVDALRRSNVLPASACRLLALGIQGGTGDDAMEEIAHRLTEEADQAMEERVALVEPALVLGTSVLVGAILLSVMLPLMNIMTVIG